MNVNELIQSLQQLANEGHGDMEVKFAYDSGSYWRNVVAVTVTNVEVGEVQYSEYYRKDVVIEDMDTEEDTQQAILLK